MLEYNTPFIHGTVATQVFGQGGRFTTQGLYQGAVNASSLSLPTGVAVDTAGRLYVAEAGSILLVMAWAFASDLPLVL